MNATRISGALKTLLVKYGLPVLQDMYIDQNSIFVNCDNGEFRFSLNDDYLKNKPGEISVPLFHWRAKRKFIEMKNVLLAGNVKQVVGMRTRAIVPKDDFLTFNILLTMEIDLIQWFFDDRISTVFSTQISKNYINAIFCTQSGIRVSAEIGEGPLGSTPIFLNEIIGRTGIISDLPVDTQIEQNSIYLLRDDKKQVYTDVDYELFGATKIEIDCIRFIMSFLSDQTSINSLKEDWRAINNVIHAVHESSKAERKVKVDYSKGEKIICAE